MSTTAKTPRFLGYVNSSGSGKEVMAAMKKKNLVRDGPLCWINTDHGIKYEDRIWIHRPKGWQPPPDTSCPKAAYKLVDVYCDSNKPMGKVWSCKFF